MIVTVRRAGWAASLEPERTKGSLAAPLACSSLAGNGHSVSQSRRAHISPKRLFFKIERLGEPRHQACEDLIEIGLRDERDFAPDLR